MQRQEKAAINLLGLAGSLRRQSFNRAGLEAMAVVCAGQHEFRIFEQTGSLPLFNPDREDEIIPAVVALKSAVSRADGLVIASPEYAHGISGVMKNALDWLVGGEAFINLPVALLNTSPRASDAQNALRLVLKTMSAAVIDEACVALPLLGTQLGRDEILKDKALVETLEKSLQAFESGIRRTGLTHERFVNE